MPSTAPPTRPAPPPATDLGRFDELRYYAASPGGSILVGARLTRHPNRRLVDAAVTVVVEGTQHSVFASARLAEPAEPSEPVARVVEVGPIRIDGNGLRCDAPASGIVADLRWAADPTGDPGDPASPVYRRTIDQPPLVADVELRDSVGSLHGTVHVGGSAAATDAAGTFRSGIALQQDRQGSRTVPDLAVPLAQAPPTALPNLFSWTATFEGRPVLHDDAELAPRWQRGTRWPDGGTLLLGGEEIRFRATAHLPVVGLGDHDPHWAPGRWHDELAIGSCRRLVGSLDPADVRHVHVMTSVVTDDGTHGLLETLVLGRHPKTDLRGFTDGWEP